ncbi:MAG: GvpL/GvpF family gas vesicle protein, partial [Candidatus Eremiobacteraeota bacterium]|nr:GvpL/GvpF family gas vesicle protein [Candidatus Eremiobacteraeota bacterium]
MPLELAGRRFSGAGKVAAAVAYGNLALVIRDMDPAQWRPEDRSWLIAQANVHQAVLERAMHAGPVLPVRLCTAFANRAQLDDLMRENQERWATSLQRLAGKQEWSLHIYAGPHVALHKEPYVMRVAPASAAGAAIDGPYAEHLAEVWKTCSDLASTSRRVEAEPNSRYIFGAVLLIRESRIENLRAVLMSYAKFARALGITYYLEGPNPP